MYRILDTWITPLCPCWSTWFMNVPESKLALKSIFVNEFFIILKNFYVSTAIIVERIIRLGFLICRQKGSAYLKMERKKILFLNQTIFLIQTICIIVIFSDSQKRSVSNYITASKDKNNEIREELVNCEYRSNINPFVLPEKVKRIIFNMKFLQKNRLIKGEIRFSMIELFFFVKLLRKFSLN